MGEYADDAIFAGLDQSWGWRSIRRIRRPNQRLAGLRIKAHNAFDPLWQDGKMTRSQAYAWLADQMKLKIEHCHIAQMNEEQCERVIDLCVPLSFEDLTK